MTVAVVALVVAVAGCASGDDATGTTGTSVVPRTVTTVDATSTTTSTTQPTTSTTATTLPEPPHLEILDPVHGATVTSRRYTFTGVTDPGCSVTVGGKYEATVAKDGSWVLDLMLKPGRNSTTFTATDPETGLATSEAIRVYYTGTLELRSDGLGVVAFGDPVENVMTILTDLFGPPSYDQLLESPFDTFEGSTGPDRGVAACHFATVPIFGGHICFDYIRVTSWSDVGLSVVFSDLMVTPRGSNADDADYVEVPPSLRGYTYSAGDTGRFARTVQGIGVGSTVRELMALGDQVTFSGPGCGDNVGFTIHDPDLGDGSWISGILVGTDGYAFLDTGYLNPDATVWWLNAGAQRSC
jgi:hypothetical protein